MTAKTTAQIHNQWQRIFRILMARGKRLAIQAHPETGGLDLYVHNWGNAEAKAVWARTWARTNRVRAIYKAAYDLAEHRQHLAAGFQPHWCEHCRNADLFN